MHIGGFSLKLVKNEEYARMRMLAKVNQKILKYDNIIKSSPLSRPLADYTSSPIDTLNLFEHIRMIPTLIRITVHTLNSFKGLDHRPTRHRINDQELNNLKKYAKTLGIPSLGFIQIDADDIIDGYGVLYNHVIVFAFPMNRDDIKSEPCFDKLKMIESTYADSGMMANKLTAYLRKMGFGAQAGPGAGGLSVYPVLAEKSGLGVFGRHGVLITKLYGPGTRLGVVYTNIENLPSTSHENNDMLWVKDFCNRCGRCIKKCPHNAIYEILQTTKGPYVTHIDTKKCLEQFNSKYGCTVCLKECSFTTVGYEKLGEKFLKNN